MGLFNWIFRKRVPTKAGTVNVGKTGRPSLSVPIIPGLLTLNVGPRPRVTANVGGGLSGQLRLDGGHAGNDLDLDAPPWAVRSADEYEDADGGGED